MNQVVSRIIKEQARKSCCRHRHGCVIILNGDIISFGKNRIKWPGISLHAEMDAIRKVRKSLLGNCVLYVGRINKQEKFINSKPCAKCENFLRRHVKHVFYTKNEKWEKLF